MMDPQSKTLNNLLLDANRRVAAGNLKVCPLCRAVNAKQNGECFCCRWHGDFIVDPEAIEEGVFELLVQCPELADTVLEPTRPRPTLRQKLRAMWRRWTVRRKLDLFA